MDYAAKPDKLDNIHADCLVIPVFDHKTLSDFGKEVDQATNAAIKDLLKSGDITGKENETVILHQPAGLKCKRLLLFGCGKPNTVTVPQFKKLIDSAWRAIDKTQSKSVYWDLFSIQSKVLDDTWIARHAIAVIEDAVYQYQATKSKKDDTKTVCQKITFLSKNLKHANKVKPAIKQAQAIAKGVSLAKELSNLPGNICTPRYLATQAKKLKSDAQFQVDILSETDMDKLGMGSLLSVSKGSREPAKLIVMHYHGAAKSDAPIVLVGKGLTFDAGGISIKPSANMDEMKYDMCGGASVFGALSACQQLQLPLNVIGVVPSSENLPDGAANKPGDIVTSLAGHTIEILNTDAEGRLILCDALTYSERFKPKYIVDIATLTGACIVALGHETSGLMGNNQKLADALRQAGEETHDRCWQLPLFDEYQDQLKSNFADIANIGGKGAGSITAGCFLSRFTENMTWAHLDIAGTAWRSGKEKGATGRPVALLTQFLINQVDTK